MDKNIFCVKKKKQKKKMSSLKKNKLVFPLFSTLITSFQNYDQ